MPSRFDIGLVCSIGLGPRRGGRSQNQDNYLICRDGELRWRQGPAEHVLPGRGSGTLLAVADGMGGHEHGELASEAAVQAVTSLYRRGRPAHPETTLRAFLLKAHRRLADRATEHGLTNLGTTLVVAWLLGDHVHWASVGDSRLYHLRGERLRQLTRDQTRGEFAHRDGRPPSADAKFLAQNFIFGSRGLGDDAGIRIDSGTDTGRLRLQVGDRLLLCSDGLSAYVQSSRIRAALREQMTSNACATWLVERAMSSGSDDNITALVVRVEAIEPLDRDDPEARALWEESPLIDPMVDTTFDGDAAQMLFDPETESDELVPEED